MQQFSMKMGFRSQFRQHPRHATILRVTLWLMLATGLTLAWQLHSANKPIPNDALDTLVLRTLHLYADVACRKIVPLLSSKATGTMYM